MAHRPFRGLPNGGAKGNGTVIGPRGRRRRAGLAALAAVALLVTACAETQLAAHMAASQAPKSQPHYKIGDPYRIGGRLYQPRESFDYVATGVASWYGPGFAGRSTANGEIFDPNALTAAHPTLQLPSIARVTNLQNGRSVEVRINDRGPFASDRLIDVSRRAAELLGFKAQGTAVVRVEVVADRSLALRAALTGQPQAPVAAPRGPVVVAAATGADVPNGEAGVSGPPSGEAADRPRSLLPASGLTAASGAPGRLGPPPAPDPRVVPALAGGGPTVAARAVPTSAIGGDGPLYVQVGAFTRRGNADSLRAGLATLGPAQVAPVTIDGVAYYRVRLGPLADRQSAGALLARVQAAGHGTARVTGP